MYCRFVILSLVCFWTSLGALAPPIGDAADGLDWQPLMEPGSGGWITAMAVSPHDSSRILVGGDVLGIGFSEDRGQTWQVPQGLRSWEIGDITWHPTDPKIAWAGTMSGPYVTTDGGRTWQERRQGMLAVGEWNYTAPIEKVLFDPHNDHRLLAFGGSSRRMTSPGEPAWGAVWESEDAGQHWIRLATILVDGKGRNIVGAAFQPGSSKVVYAAVDHAGLFVSGDGGKTWKETGAGLPNRNIERVAVHRDDENAVWVVLGNHKPTGSDKFHPGGVFKSADGGATFVSIGKGLNASSDANENFTARYKGFAISRTDPRVMVVGETTWNHPCVWRTDDGGNNWKVVALDKKPGILETAYPGGPAATVAEIDPRDARTCYAAGAEYIIQTTDGGKTWTDLTAVRVGDRGWRGRGYSGLCTVNIRFNPHKPGHVVFSAMDAGKLWESTDGMKSWGFHGQEPWPWGGGNDVAFTDDSHVYATGGQFGSYACIYRTLDGKSWSVVRGEEHGLPAFEGAGIATGIHALPQEPKHVWAVVAGGLYESTDAGDHWRSAMEESDLGWIAADPRDARRFYVSGSKSVYVTEDGRQFRSIGGSKMAGRMACDTLGRLYLAAYRGPRGGLWRYADGQWLRLIADAMVVNVAVDPSSPERVAVITNDDPYHDVCRSRGVLISANAGKTWASANLGLGMLRGHAITFNPYDPEQLICGTQGRGFFIARWSKTFIPPGEEQYVATAEDARFAAEVPPASNRERLAVRNGDMTEGADKPTGWTNEYGSKGKIAVSRDTETYHSKPASLHLQSVGGAADGQASQLFDAPGGLTVQLIGYIRAEGGATALLGLMAYDKNWKGLGFTPVGNAISGFGWRKAEGKATTPPGTAHAAIVCMIQGEGHVWLDDASLDGKDLGKDAQPKTGKIAVKPKPQGPRKPTGSCDPAEGFWPDFPDAWRQVLAGQLQRAKQGPARIVFLGDSLVQGWSEQPRWKEHYAKLGAVNFGIGGDGTPQLLYRIDKGILDGLDPKVVVLSVGVNNVWPGFDAEDTIKGITRVVEQIRRRAPQAKILLVSNWHFFDKGDGGSRRRVDTINAALKKLADGKQVRLAEISEKLLKADRELGSRYYVGDKLHLSAEGYGVWAETMDPVLEEMLK